MQLAHQAALRLGPLEVRPATREVIGPEGREVLQPRVMQVLVALAQAQGAVVSRDDLIERCWDGRIVGDDAITFVMVKLRKLGARTGGFALETIPRVGYRLAPAGSNRAPAPATAPPKGIGRRGALAIGGAALAVAAGGAALWRARQPSAAPVTLAVLPFEDLSPGTTAKFMAEGLARELRNSLSRVAGLRVIADASSFVLAGQGLGLAELGKRLHASLLVKGSVLQAGAELRTTVELVDVASGLQVWADSRDSQGGDLFQLQDALAGAVIQELIARVGADRIREPPSRRARNPEVFRLMLGATQLLEQTRALSMNGHDAESADAADAAMKLARQALAIDPADVGALVVLASLVRNGWSRELAAQPLTTAERGAQAADLLRQALLTDPNDPSALAALGDIFRRIEWRWTEAETLFQRALAVDPNHVEALWAYSYLLELLGRAVEGLGHARALMRLDPETVWRRLALPRGLYCAGQFKAAAALFDRELAANPSNLFLIREHYMMRLSETDAPGMRRLIVRVRDELWRGRARTPPLEALLARMAAGAEALEGRPAGLIKLVDADVAAWDAAWGHGGTPQGRASVDLLFIYAMEYAWAGEVGPSMRLLDRALAARSTYWVPSMPYAFARFPERVRDDPRYAAVWAAEPQRMELVRRRREAIERGQMAGFAPDGRKVIPSLPPDPDPIPLNG